MKGEWEDLTLGDLGRVVTGKTPLTSVEGNFGGQIPFVTPSDMDSRRTISTTARYLTETGAASVKGSKIPAGSIMVSCIGSDMGKVVIAGRDCVTNQQINSIVVDDRFSSEFVYYSLSTRKTEIRHQAAGGSAVPILNKGDFSRMEITLPPLDEQKAIAAVLGALDDKIELNRRMNATLEAIARSLFQSWFVDFDPVRANMDCSATGQPSPQPSPTGRGSKDREKAELPSPLGRRAGDEGAFGFLDGRPPAALDPATAALFPEHLEDSPLGHIPKGWKVGTIQDCCVQIQNGGTPRRNEPRFWDGGNIPWLASGEVRQSIIIATESFITEEGLAESSAKWVPAFSTVVALYGATAGQVSFISSRLTTNQAVCALIPRKGYAFFNYLTMRGATAELENKAVGSAQQNISKGIVEETKVVLPPPALVERFAALASPLFERWISNLHQSRTLATLRDTLLPKLLSGELSVTKLDN
jgi:type I restriction enzyme S subunit